MNKFTIVYRKTNIVRLITYQRSLYRIHYLSLLIKPNEQTDLNIENDGVISEKVVIEHNIQLLLIV